MSLIRTLKVAKQTKVEYNEFYSTPKDKRKFLDDTKKIVRASKEYKDYIQFLKQYMDMNHCFFFKNVKQSKEAKVSIEVHHFPLTLEEITAIVIEKHLQNGNVLSTLEVADEVCELHYNNMVGLVPLSVSLHEAIHSDDSDEFPIPIYAVYGNFEKFLDDYGIYIDANYEYIYDKLERIVNKTKELTPEEFLKLAVEYEYIDMDGVEQHDQFKLASDQMTA